MMLADFWSDLRFRLRAIIHGKAMDRDLDDEVRFHIEKEAEKHERLGSTRDEALRRARIAFGSVEDARERSRDARGTALVNEIARDLRYASRSLRHQPAFTAAVILTLAIGIGANTTVFTLLDALLLRPLPVSHPEQLVTIGKSSNVHSGWHGSPMVDYVSYPVYEDVRDGNRVLSGIYASGDADIEMAAPRGSGGEVENPSARYVSDNFFAVLGISPFVGRAFLREKDAGAVTVINYGYWQRRFGGARSILGATLTMNGVPVTVVGIAPAGFTGDIVGETTDLWLPITLQPVLQHGGRLLQDRTVSWLQMMGRLAPGVTLAQARRELAGIELRSIRAHLSPEELADFDNDIRTDPVRVEGGAQGFSAQRGEYASALFVLMAAVGLVVLVVCANVCSLMLARAIARQREMTVRMSLGAARRRLLMQLMTESTILGVVSGALGLFATIWATRFILALVAAGGSPIDLDARPDARILGFTLAITFLCVVAFGLVPAFRATRVDIASALRANTRGLVGGRATMGKLLVVAQIALCTTLLVGGGLLVRSMRELLRADLGLDRDHLILVHIAASKTGYVGAHLQEFRNQTARTAAALPGVVGAAYTQEGLFSGGESLGHVDIAGVIARTDTLAAISYDRVGAGFFHAVGAALLRGRDFEAHDADAGVNSAIIDATMAKAYFPRGDAIGRAITLDSVTYTVVGIVRDLQERSVRETPVRRMYLSQPQPSTRAISFELIVRTSGDPTTYVAPLRAALAAAAPNAPVSLTPLDDRIRTSISRDVLLTRVTAFFGIVTLLLAAIGLYGVIAYSISRRTSEFGLRIALGAASMRVAGMIVAEGVGVAAVGVLVGLPAGLLAARLIRNQIFGVSAFDVPTMLGAVAVLIGTAVLASVVPARRAARVSPMRALQAE